MNSTQGQRGQIGVSSVHVYKSDQAIRSKNRGSILVNSHGIGCGRNPVVMHLRRVVDRGDNDLNLSDILQCPASSVVAIIVDRDRDLVGIARMRLGLIGQRGQSRVYRVYITSESHSIRVGTSDRHTRCVGKVQ